MSIMRGMLRASIVAAALVAIVGAVASHLEAFAEQERAIKSWMEDTRNGEDLADSSIQIAKPQRVTNQKSESQMNTSSRFIVAAASWCWFQSGNDTQIAIQ
jgi:hypothetical protein